MARSHMNMLIICVRSFCGVNEVPDFTNCKRVPGRAYNGANGKKIAIEYQGEQYIKKLTKALADACEMEGWIFSDHTKRS